MEISKPYNSVPVKDNCAVFSLPPHFRARAIRWGHLNFSPADPRCHGNEFWDKIDCSSASVKDNCALFTATSYFRARAIRWCHLNFSLADLRCHGNEFWDKIDYNSVPVTRRAVCTYPYPLFSGPAYSMVSNISPMSTPVAMATNRSYSKTKLAASDIVTSHIIFFLAFSSFISPLHSFVNC